MKIKKTIYCALTSMLILSVFYFPIKANAINQVISLKSIEKKTYYISYTVQRGDTLYSVAKKYHIATTQIQKDNRLKSTSLKTGQVLKIQVTTYITIVNIPTINTLPPVTSLNSSSYVVSGSIEANGTIAFSFKDSKGSTISYTAKADNKGKFYSKVNLSRLIDGKITLTAYQKNTKGVKSNNTVKSMFKDTIGPAVSFQTTTISSKNQSSFVIAGTSEASATISLTVSDKKHSDLKKTTTTDLKGRFSTSMDVHSLNEGTLTISAVAKDRYGNTKISSSTVTKDTITPIISLNVSNISSNNQASFPISGTTDSNSVVKLTVTDNKTTINSTINTDSSGKFSKNIDLHTLNDGTITIDVISSDKAGNAAEKKVNVKKSTSVTIPLPPVVSDPTPPQTLKTYELDAAARTKWGIYNDGTHPVETTKGINAALKWAHDNGYNIFHVPTGTYLISKADGAWYNQDSYIVMQSNMTFLLDDNAVIQKETNAYTGYKTLVVPLFTHDVVIKGGTYRGDKDTHNYYDGAVKWEVNKTYKTGDKVISTNTVADSSAYYYVATNDGVSGTKEPVWSNSKNTADNTVIWKPVARNTNEGGYGIITTGAYNVTIDGIKATNFTGDGLALGGDRAYFGDGISQNTFEVGSIDDSGNKVVDSTKLRTKGFLPLTDPTFNTTHTFVIDMVAGVSQNYDAYFYKADGTFLSKAANQQRGYFVQIPSGATKVALVFTGSLNSGIRMEFQNKVQSTNVIVKNSEFSFNRRQGITVGGGNNVLIENNKIHDIKGTMPQAGIDVEGGFWEDGTLNTNITIRTNEFYNNAKYNIVLYDGNTALVEGNKFTDAIGISIPSPFTNATVKDNDFYHASIYAYHDVHFIGNTFKYSYTYLEGPNITIDGMDFEYSRFFMYATKPYGIKANNITTLGTVIGIWNQPVELNNITAKDLSFDSATAKAADGTIINNLKATGDLVGSLPNATYNNCSFQLSGYLNRYPLIDKAGTYVFNNCSFGGKITAMKITSPGADVTINQSTFDIPNDSSAILVEKAKSIDIENNNIKSNAAIGTQKSVVMVGDDWSNANVSSILKTIIKGNTITSLAGANAISTTFAGSNASSFDIENNILYNGKLQLKQNDINLNNQLLTK